MYPRQNFPDPEPTSCPYEQNVWWTLSHGEDWVQSCIVYPYPMVSDTFRVTDEQEYSISSRVGRGGVGMSGTFTGTRVYASRTDREELGEGAAAETPNFGVCIRARRDRMGDMRRKLCTARSSVVRSVKCAYAGCNATNRDHFHASTSRSLVRWRQSLWISVYNRERPCLLHISLLG